MTVEASFLAKAEGEATSVATTSTFPYSDAILIIWPRLSHLLDTTSRGIPSSESMATPVDMPGSMPRIRYLEGV